LSTGRTSHVHGARSDYPTDDPVDRSVTSPFPAALPRPLHAAQEISCDSTQQSSSASLPLSPTTLCDSARDSFAFAAASAMIPSVSRPRTACRLSSRCFSSSSRHHEAYGFIGLGQMGFRMAKNLRAKLSADDNLVIHDVDHKALETFAREAGSNTHIAKDARQVAEESVCSLPVTFGRHTSCLIN